MKWPNVKLDNWFFDPFWNVCLCGNVSGHPDPRQYDGKVVHTGKIVAFHPEKNIFKTSSGTVYELGESNGEQPTEFLDKVLSDFRKTVGVLTLE